MTQEKQKVYYWNARLGGKTAVLAGPFMTASEAEETANIVSPVFILDEPAAEQASFGVMQVNAPGCGDGRYNNFLPPEIMVNLAVDDGKPN
jgi:hypothetical protein